MKRILFVLLFAFSFVNCLWSNTVSLPDTTIPRGSIYYVPIISDIETNIINNVEFVFEFDQYVIDVKGVGVSEESQLKNAGVTVWQDLASTPAVLKVSFSNANTQLISGELFRLQIEGLVAPRDTTAFTCTQLKIDNSIFPINTTTSIIKVPGEAIQQDYPLGLYINYPNPFDDYTTFQFNLDAETEVSFEIYSYLGVKMYDFDDLKRHIVIYGVSRESGKTPVGDINKPLVKGKYLMDFNADEYYMPSGGYILTMKTKDKFFSQSFLYVK